MSNAPDGSGPADDALQALREAVRLSPNNLPLRQHLADTLFSHGLPEEAEKEYRAALELAPNSLPLRLGLARAFFSKANKVMRW